MHFCLLPKEDAVILVSSITLAATLPNTQKHDTHSMKSFKLLRRACAGVSYNSPSPASPSWAHTSSLNSTALLGLYLPLLAPQDQVHLPLLGSHYPALSVLPSSLLNVCRAMQRGEIKEKVLVTFLLQYMFLLFIIQWITFLSRRGAGELSWQQGKNYVLLPNSLRQDFNLQ